jgi:subtilisin-like proprotein convertase family protein
VYDTITVSGAPGNFSISDISVRLDSVVVLHANDLEFRLIHQGIQDTIIYQVNSSGANFVRTTLNDSSVTNIANGTPPFTGFFKPSNPLVPLESTLPNGDWLLRIYNRSATNSAILHGWTLSLMSNSIIGIKKQGFEIPQDFILYQNYPNPFNPTTKIKFDIKAEFRSQELEVKLVIYDILGKEIQTLVNEKLQPGTYEVTFDGSNLPSGIYFYQLKTDNFIATKKLILLK